VANIIEYLKGLFKKEKKSALLEYPNDFVGDGPYVTFVYDRCLHSSEIEMHVKAGEMKSLLWDIDNQLRSLIKYDMNSYRGVRLNSRKHPNNAVIELAEQIRSHIWEDGLVLE
jgi:hypothetical protein